MYLAQVSDLRVLDSGRFFFFNVWQLRARSLPELQGAKEQCKTSIENGCKWNDFKVSAVTARCSGDGDGVTLVM